jgi:hypothetical protein
VLLVTDAITLIDRKYRCPSKISNILSHFTNGAKAIRPKELGMKCHAQDRTGRSYLSNEWPMKLKASFMLTMMVGI